MKFSRVPLVLPLTIATTVLSVAVIHLQQQRDGYRDTPILPGQKWHVHDPDRPYPPEVTPGATNAEAPSDAVVLFNGGDLSQWGQQGRGPDKGKLVDPKWKVENGEIVVVGGTGDLTTRQKFGDCQLHVEWREQPDVTGESQGRGNSGIYLMGQFETQVLDSYKHATYADGQASALYGQWPPMVNPIRPPGEWQTYDIIFTAPKWDGSRMVEPAYETVIFNGVLVHNHQKLNGPTGHRSIPKYVPGVSEGPILIQDHGPHEPLHFRNIWVRPIKGYDVGG